MNWDSDETEWRRALYWYSEALKLHEETHGKKDGLSSLENELDKIGVNARERDPSYMTGSEYSTLVKWKLKRGKWRPRLQGFADGLSGENVKEQTKKALELLRCGKTRAAISALVELRGCGPATASGVLSFIDHNVPFMGDELLECIPIFGGRRDYTLKTYMTLVEQVQIKVNQLGGDWNARKIENAVFSAAVAKRLGCETELSKLEIGTDSGKKEDVDSDCEGNTNKVVESKSRKRNRSKIEDETVKKDEADEIVDKPDDKNGVKRTQNKKKKKVSETSRSSGTRRVSARLRKKEVN